jgi:hypothetical protein
MFDWTWARATIQEEMREQEAINGFNTSQGPVRSGRSGSGPWTWDRRLEIRDRLGYRYFCCSEQRQRVHVRKGSGCVLHLHAVVAEAVWLCGTASALLSLGWQSNEDKRQCKETKARRKTHTGCLRSYLGFRVGLDIVELRMGLFRHAVKI